MWWEHDECCDGGLIYELATYVFLAGSVTCLLFALHRIASALKLGARAKAYEAVGPATTIPAATAQAISGLPITKAYVVGGAAAVADSVVAALPPGSVRVAAELVRYGRELASRGDAQVGGSFCGDPEADRLIEERPEAFLFGVLFTQGIPAERAWRGPLELSRRLGHLDPVRLAREPGALRAAFQRPPMLHRFKETLPRWISAAASRLNEVYGGDASRIWEPGSHVLDVVERLSGFDGIGRKKAAMAVEILVRHFRVPLEGLEYGEAAFDVHVRRVFLRSGLVDEDTPDAVAAAARLACREAPGTLDLPAWLVGRSTCRPKVPRCDQCRLGSVCPRRVWLTPEGVGVRRGSRNPAQSTARNSSPESSLG